MQRRNVLAMTGTVLAAGLAGCSSETDSGNGGNGGNGSNEDSSSTPTHEVGEPFTVGDGGQTVEYTVNSVNAYSELGGQFTSEQASGVYAVVEIEMTNQTDETVDISSNHLKLVNSENQQFDAAVGAGVYADSDSRVQSESIAFEQLNPGLSTSGAVIFDVNPGSTYDLLVKPLGLFSSASSHRVALGEIGAE